MCGQSTLCLRDQIALTALRELIPLYYAATVDDLSHLAYALADAMLKARGSAGENEKKAFYVCVDGCGKTGPNGCGGNDHKVLLFPPGCTCDFDDWALAPIVPPICDTFVPGEFGDQEWDGAICSKCEHTKGCHTPGEK